MIGAISSRAQNADSACLANLTRSEREREEWSGAGANTPNENCQVGRACVCECGAADKISRLQNQFVAMAKRPALFCLPKLLVRSRNQ